MRLDRPAFTLIELLVLIGVIGILTAITLPAIHYAHEAARRTHCQNNLKQIGLGVQAHVSSHKHFPTNGWGFRWVGEPDRGFSVLQPGGWIYNILPYVEAENLRLIGKRQRDLERSVTLIRLLKSDLSVFSCPTRHEGLLPADPRFKLRNSFMVPEVAKTDYAINEGDWITNTDAGPETIAEAERGKYMWKDCSKATGVSFQRSTLRPGQLNDGASHTYLVGEKYVMSDSHSDYSDTGYDQPMYTGVDLDLNRWTVDPPLADNESPTQTLGDVLPYPRRFGSSHRVCHFVFCDGRVEVVDYDIQVELHRRRGNRADNTPAAR